MFNQTTPGWMHWSSLPDTAGFLDTEGCKPPHYHHGLSSASAYAMLRLRVMKSKGSMGVPADAKRTTSRILFRCRHTWTTALGWVVPPYKQECQEAPSATLEATDTDAGRPPPLPTHHAHEQHTSFREASKTQRGRGRRSNSSAHPVHWETVKKSASWADGARIGNQSRISRGSWVVD